jgi:hypothetical protein
MCLWLIQKEKCDSTKLTPTIIEKITWLNVYNHNKYEVNSWIDIGKMFDISDIYSLSNFHTLSYNFFLIRIMIRSNYILVLPVLLDEEYWSFQYRVFYNTSITSIVGWRILELPVLCVLQYYNTRNTSIVMLQYW